jgi:hypothetical protein
LGKQVIAVAYRRAAHGPNVIDRIKRRDAAVIRWIINNGREEIERLHQRQIIAQSIHSGVVRFVETDQQIRIVRLSLKPAQHLSEDRRAPAWPLNQSMKPSQLDASRFLLSRFNMVLRSPKNKPPGGDFFYPDV